MNRTLHACETRGICKADVWNGVRVGLQSSGRIWIDNYRVFH